MIKFKWETEFKETPIGKIPKEWEVKEIQEIGDVSGGTTPSTKVKEYWDGDVAWITPKDLADYEKRYIKKGSRNITKLAVKKYSMKIFPPGTILLTSRAPIGYVAIAEGHVTTNQGFRNIIPKDKRTSEYLYYLLKLLKPYLENIAGGSTFPELSGRTLKSVLIPYHSPEEQQRIATVLSWFDDLIENKRRQNEILEKTAMAIFKSWFIDFEPFQDEEFVYSEELDMEIPKGWGVKPIGEIAEFTNGLSYKGSEKFSEYKDGAYVFITLNNVKRGGGFKSEYAWIKSDRLKKRHFLVEGDLIMANTDMTQDAKVIGAPALVIFPSDYTKQMGVYSHHITRIQPKEKNWKLFMYLYLKYTQEDNVTFSTGTNVLGLDIDNFKQNKYILVPPKPILEKFHSLVEPLFRKIILNEKKIMLLKKVRDTLLPQLVFGRLRVVEI